MDAFAELIKAKQPRLYSTLLGTEPAIKEDHLIEIALNNELQSTVFEKISIQLKHFLRQSLNNGQIEVSTIIVAQEIKKSKKLFTDADKFRYLAEKNQTLHKLRESFKLDFG